MVRHVLPKPRTQNITAREIEERHSIRLSIQQQRKFVALLLNPPKPNKALKRAATAHAKFVSCVRPT